jgi:hypothetical protein
MLHSDPIFIFLRSGTVFGKVFSVSVTTWVNLDKHHG